MEGRVNIALSGASGFIGSYLTTFFTGMGYRIIPLTRENLTADPAKLDGIISGAEAVINLAGAPILHRWSKTWKKEILDSRIETTRSIVDAIQRIPDKPNVFISSSAIGYYATGYCYDEYNAVRGDDFLAEVCEKWEREAMAISGKVRTAIARFGIVLAKSGGAFEKMIISNRWKVSTVIGPGNQDFSWIDIHDLARAIYHLILNKDQSGVYNFTAPEQITYRQFADMAGKYTHSKLTIKVPSFALKMVLGEAGNFLIGGQCAIPTRLEEAGFHFQSPNLERFLSKLN